MRIMLFNSFGDGSKLIDTEVDAAVLILTEQSKKNISNMPDGTLVYGEFPDKHNASDVRYMMEEALEHKKSEIRAITRAYVRDFFRAITEEELGDGGD